jgi:hypothetical protein
MKPLAIGQALECRVELSGALELGSYAAQGLLEVLVERGGL